MIKYIFSIILVMGLFNTTYGQDVISDQQEVKYKTKTFKVYGNCGMCKRTIEGSLKEESSISEALWDIDSGEMKVSYNSKSMTLGEIKQKIADVGYDTDTYRAKVEVYRALPGCCQYERPE